MIMGEYLTIIPVVIYGVCLLFSPCFFGLFSLLFLSQCHFVTMNYPNLASLPFSQWSSPLFFACIPWRCHGSLSLSCLMPLTKGITNKAACPSRTLCSSKIDIHVSLSLSPHGLWFHSGLHSPKKGSSLRIFFLGISPFSASPASPATPR